MIEFDKLEICSNTGNVINDVSIGRQINTSLNNSIDHQSRIPSKNNSVKPNFNNKLDNSSTSLCFHISLQKNRPALTVFSRRFSKLP